MTKLFQGGTTYHITAAARTIPGNANVGDINAELTEAAVLSVYMVQYRATAVVDNFLCIVFRPTQNSLSAVFIRNKKHASVSTTVKSAVQCTAVCVIVASRSRAVHDITLDDYACHVPGPACLAC